MRRAGVRNGRETARQRQTWRPEEGQRSDPSPRAKAVPAGTRPRARRHPDGYTDQRRRSAKARCGAQGCVSVRSAWTVPIFMSGKQHCRATTVSERIHRTVPIGVEISALPSAQGETTYYSRPTLSARRMRSNEFHSTSSRGQCPLCMKAIVVRLRDCTLNGHDDGCCARHADKHSLSDRWRIICWGDLGASA